MSFNGSRLLTCFSGEDSRSSGVAQHPADHRPIIGVEAVVTHGAPDPVVPHLHSTSPSTRHQTHDHCGDKGAATKQVQEPVHSSAAPLRLPTWPLLWMIQKQLSFSTRASRLKLPSLWPHQACADLLSWSPLAPLSPWGPGGNMEGKHLKYIFKPNSHWQNDTADTVFVTSFIYWWNVKIIVLLNKLIHRSFCLKHTQSETQSCCPSQNRQPRKSMFDFRCF